MKISDYEAIIFDLGGVILPIAYQKTSESFKTLGINNFEEIYSQAAQSGLFDRFEIGEISQQHFINSILDFLPNQSSANKVVAAWNAMLLEFPIENLKFLEKIKKETRSFLLSNTNEIHVQAFNRKLKRVSGYQSLHPYFEQVYFSNEIGKRKPHPETFSYICEINGIQAEKTLFIDDSIQHIEGAKKIGLNTHHMQKGEKISDLFS